jgi:hypothetical protein
MNPLLVQARQASKLSKLSNTSMEIAALQAERTMLRACLSNPDYYYVADQNSTTFKITQIAYSRDVKRLKEINAILNAFYIKSRGL